MQRLNSPLGLNMWCPRPGENETKQQRINPKETLYKSKTRENSMNRLTTADVPAIFAGCPFAPEVTSYLCS